MNKMENLDPKDPTQCAMEMDRAKAMDRAFLMSRLFRKEYFYEIIAIINSEKIKSDKPPTEFVDVCMKALEGVSKNETVIRKQSRWLWNYLKNYSPENAWNSPVAPTNGW
jgi:hypothetical protein